jgi:hypothetical protein
MKITVSPELESKRPFTASETAALVVDELNPIWLGLVAAMYVSLYSGMYFSGAKEEDRAFLGMHLVDLIALFSILGAFPLLWLAYRFFRKKRGTLKQTKEWWAGNVERRYAIYSCRRGERCAFVGTIPSSSLSEYMARLYETNDALHVALPFRRRDVGRAQMGAYPETVADRPKCHKVNSELCGWTFRAIRLTKFESEGRLDVELSMEDPSGAALRLSLQEAADFIFSAPFGSIRIRDSDAATISAAVATLASQKRMFVKCWKKEEEAKEKAHDRLYDTMNALSAARQDDAASGIRAFLKREMSPSDPRWAGLSSSEATAA